MHRKNWHHNWIGGRRPENVGKPGERHVYARTPNLQALREAANLTVEEAGEIVRSQGYSAATIRALENGEAMPRMTISRVTAALGDYIGDKNAISAAEAKGDY